MPEFSAPGVYVEGIPSGTVPLSRARTAIPLLIGIAADDAPADHEHPTAIASWARRRSPPAGRPRSSASRR